VPRAWKHSIVSPHFKRGDLGAASSWRTVASPHPLLKTLGRVVQRRYQARFAECVSEWLCPRAIHERAVPAVDAVNSRCHRDKSFRPVAFVDITRAYDNVWRAGLLLKLRHFGFPLTLIRWIKGLLHDREYRVRLGSWLLRGYCPHKRVSLLETRLAVICSPCSTAMLLGFRGPR